MKMLEGVIFMPSSRKAQRNCSILKINSKMTRKNSKVVKWPLWPNFMTETRTLVFVLQWLNQLDHVRLVLIFDDWSRTVVQTWSHVIVVSKLTVLDWQHWRYWILIGPRAMKRIQSRLWRISLKDLFTQFRSP